MAPPSIFFSSRGNLQEIARKPKHISNPNGAETGSRTVIRLNERSYKLIRTYLKIRLLRNENKLDESEYFMPCLLRLKAETPESGQPSGVSG
jgi:hypothetical protein